MPPVSLPVPNFPKEEPSSETETPDVSPKDSATKFQSASESEPFLMPPVSQPVPNFPITDPTTKLQSKLPNKRSQRAPSSEPSKSSLFVADCNFVVVPVGGADDGFSFGKLGTG